MKIAVTDKQIRAWALQRPGALKAKFDRYGNVYVFGQRRAGGIGWYLLSTRDDIAAALPLRAADGDRIAAAILDGSHSNRPADPAVSARAERRSVSSSQAERHPLASKRRNAGSGVSPPEPAS